MTEAERIKIEALLQAIDRRELPLEPARNGAMVCPYDNDRLWRTYEVLKKIGLL
jgi:hypothetical protein